MKFSKKIILSALMAMTAFVLVACGNSGPNHSKQSSQSQASSSVPQSSEMVSSNRTMEIGRASCRERV